MVDLPTASSHHCDAGSIRIFFRQLAVAVTGVCTCVTQERLHMCIYSAPLLVNIVLCLRGWGSLGGGVGL